MGEYDLVEQVLTELGAEFFFTGVRMQPGRPVVFGRLPAIPSPHSSPALPPTNPSPESLPTLDSRPEPLQPVESSPETLPALFFFGLPGNPVSTQVTFQVFAEPLLRALCGTIPTPPRFVQATLTEAVAGKPNVTRLLPGIFTPSAAQPTISLVGWQGSGDVAANARANAYALFPPSPDPTPANTVITVLLQ